MSEQGCCGRLGVDINYGSFPDAFNALVDNVNAHGGINGRKIVPYIVAVTPVGTAPAATACTQLTEDDSVFVVLAPLEATCYLEHNMAVVGSIYPSGHSSTAAQDFSPTPPPAAFDPLELSAIDKQGVFKHKKVAIFGGGPGDESELAVVQSALAKLHVPVVTTAVDTAPQGDQAAETAQIGPIAQRFQSEGVTEVVAVGTGAAVWPGGLSNIQSSYNPPWVATVETDFNGAVGSGDSGSLPLERRDLDRTSASGRDLEQRRDAGVRPHHQEGVSLGRDPGLQRQPARVRGRPGRPLRLRAATWRCSKTLPRPRGRT